MTPEERRAGDDRAAGGLASFSRLSVRPAPHSAFRGSERWESSLLFRGTQEASGRLQGALTFVLAGRRTLVGRASAHRPSPGGGRVRHVVRGAAARLRDGLRGPASFTEAARTRLPVHASTARVVVTAMCPAGRANFPRRRR